MPIVEKRYAEALIELSLNDKAIDDYKNELSNLANIYNNQSDLSMFLLNPEVKIDIKKEVIKNIFENQVNSNVLNFLMLLLDKGRIKFLPGIVKEFSMLADLMKNTLNMTIISASSIEDSQIEKIKEKYMSIYKATAVNANIEIDKSLIGGIKVVIGDRVIDSSIQGRLENLRQVLVES